MKPLKTYQVTALWALLAALLIFQAIVLAHWAWSAEKVKEKPLVEPGWIICMGELAKHLPACRIFILDGPAPVIGQ